MSSEVEPTQVEPDVTPAGDTGPEAAPPNADVTPAWLPEFERTHGKVEKSLVRESPEATLAEVTKAYTSIREKMSKGEHKQPEPEAKPAEPAKVTALSDAVKAAGLDSDELIEQYQANGELTAEQYAALEAKGWTKAAVNETADGLAAKKSLAAQEAQARVNTAYDIAGGEDGYKQLTEFIKNNYTTDQIEAFNASVGGTKAQMEMAVRDAVSRYRESVGAGGSSPLVAGDVASGSVQGFSSDAEHELWLSENLDVYKNPEKMKQYQARLVKSTKILGG